MNINGGTVPSSQHCFEQHAVFTLLLLLTTRLLLLTCSSSKSAYTYHILHTAQHMQASLQVMEELLLFQRSYQCVIYTQGVGCVWQHASSTFLLHTAQHMQASLQVVEELLLQRNYQRGVYLGDGRGDFCPCTKLGPRDHILARQQYPDGTACALPQLLAQQGNMSRKHREQHTKQQTHQPHAKDCIFSSAQRASKVGNEDSSSMQAAVAPSTERMSSQCDNPDSLKRKWSHAEGNNDVSMADAASTSTAAGCKGKGNSVKGETGESNAEVLDQARYQGADNVVEPDESLPPPPPRPSGLQSSPAKQRSQCGHACVASLQSWTSASAAADMLRALI